MPWEGSVCTEESLFFENLFRKEYDGLLRYANIILQKFGAGHVSASDRAEDVVQELFFLAWERREELITNETPERWLYNALVLKVREALREDRAWVKRLALTPEVYGRPGPSQQLPAEWNDLLPPEDLRLLRQLYVDGYSYQELCEALGVKKSTLAMKIYRIKEKFRNSFKIE